MRSCSFVRGMSVKFTPPIVMTSPKRSADSAVCLPLTNTPDLECASEIVQLPSS